MVRFEKKRSRSGGLRALLIPLCLFAAVAAIVWSGLDSLDSGTREQQLKSTEQALRRAAVHCYAVEGRYPPDVAYLAERYGVAVDENACTVYYSLVGDNLMPDIAVFPVNQ